LEVDSNQFDRVTRLFSSRLTRRSAITTSAAAAATALAARSVVAQDATPAAGSDKLSFLFVQLASDGTWQQKADEPGVYTLTLSGASDQTLFFSDRPERIVGTVPTDQFFDGLGFTPENPPNAALVVKTPEGERDVLVIELLNPVYSETFGDASNVQVTYDARVLQGYSGEGLAEWSKEQLDDLLPEQFTDASLFIDDCPDITTCYRPGPTIVGPFPGGNWGQCWDWSRLSCQPCNADLSALDQKCNDAYPHCYGVCCAAAGWTLCFK
jgi:hypothetical protein